MSNQNELTANYALEVREKKTFHDLIKKADLPIMAEKADENPLLKYHKDSIKQKVIPLPILFKIRNQQLILKGYRLNDGLCESLKKALQTNKELLTLIKLSDNGIADEDMYTVMFI